MFDANQCCRYRFLDALFERADTSASLRASAIFRHILEPTDRVLLGVSVNLSCDPDEIVEIAEAALQHNTFGMPLPTFSTPMSDARWWAERATLDEKKAFLIATYDALSNSKQRDFIRHVTTRLCR